MSIEDMEIFTQSQIMAEVIRSTGKSVDEVLDAAADLIESEGLLKGQFYRQGEGYCTLGAIRAAEFGTTDLHRGEDMDLVDVLIPTTEELKATPTGWLWEHLGSRPISFWNDGNHTTQVEVIQTLRDAATKYRNR